MKLPTLNQLIALAAVVIAGLALWTFWPKPSLEVGVASPLPTAKEVIKTERVVTEVKVVYVYPDKVKGDLGLPEQVKQDKNKKVTATGKLNAEERPYTLSAVIDTETGVSEVYARPDPLPWIGPGRTGAVGIAYGLKNGQPMGRLYAHHDLLQVKAFRLGATATLDQDSDWFAGGFIEYRF